MSKLMTDSSLTDPCRAKLAACADQLRGLGRVVIAASGGVDSTFLLALAAETLGAENVLAVTARGPLYPPDEPDEAGAVARELGVEHVIADANALAVPAVAANPPDRCYHCKTMVFGLVKDLAAERGIAAVASGDQADDPGDYRPGLKAIQELAIVTPLLDAGLTKADIRAASAVMGLATADKPSAACLASRVPYNQPLTAEGLQRIARAEKVLHELGFRQCRVRDHDPLARIEVTPDELPRAFELRERLVAALKDLGYAYVTLDLQGFRSGALNEVLDR
ncbi:MAG: ATP-dependent sacrificial sulfur transferase LarE [Planctomycetota bacterium]